MVTHEWSPDWHIKVIWTGDGDDRVISIRQFLINSRNDTISSCSFPVIVSVSFYYGNSRSHYYIFEVVTEQNITRISFGYVFIQFLSYKFRIHTWCLNLLLQNSTEFIVFCTLINHNHNSHRAVQFLILSRLKTLNFKELQHSCEEFSKDYLDDLNANQLNIEWYESRRIFERCGE